MILSNQPLTTIFNVSNKSIFNSDDDIRIEKTESGADIYIFDPYNPLNKEITKKNIEDILKRYGVNVPIYNEKLYKRAFINKSYLRRPDIENLQNNITIVPKPDNCMPLFTKSNERLEYLGDGVLDCIAKWILYQRFPQADEAFMTEKKIELVKNEAIGALMMEMGLHEWVVLSKHAETKNTRTNLKKLGCVFEAFVGAIFLDYNKVDVNDEHGWFKHTFLSGPGFQMAQIFIENVFNKHVNWMKLIGTNDNYKNLLQVRIQKEFKVTPEYIEVSEQSNETGYHMGVYLCLGQPVFGLTHKNSLAYSQFNDFQEIHEYMSKHSKAFIFLGEGKHKIKKKAEQFACENALRHFTKMNA
jgi:dsRNA-specific ribonuclease